MSEKDLPLWRQPLNLEAEAALKARSSQEAKGGQSRTSESTVPLYTTIVWDLAFRWKLSEAEYAIIDAIWRLSSKPGYEWCEKTPEQLAKGFRKSKATGHRAVSKGVKLGLVEKKGHQMLGLRTTVLYYDEFVIPKKRIMRKGKRS